MKLQRLASVCLSLFLLTPCPALSNDDNHAAATSDPATNAAQAVEERDIVVTGERRKQVEAIRGLTSEITRKPRIGKPLSRFYQSFCLNVIGLNQKYAAVVAERIERNARELGIPVGTGKCAPNALLIFTKDGRKAVETLRKDEPWLFTNLLDYEYKRVLAGNGATHAWHVTELRGVDGKPLRVMDIDIDGVKRELAVNDQFQTGRLNQPIRLDMRGAVVVIDTAYLPGKTLDQLADYATMRLLASTDDAPQDEADAVSTILSLFTAPDSAPPTLSQFDHSYLSALYTLRPNANALAIRDATVRSWLHQAGD